MHCVDCLEAITPYQHPVESSCSNPITCDTIQDLVKATVVNRLRANRVIDSIQGKALHVAASTPGTCEIGSCRSHSDGRAEVVRDILIRLLFYDSVAFYGLEPNSRPPDSYKEDPFPCHSKEAQVRV